ASFQLFKIVPDDFVATVQPCSASAREIFKPASQGNVLLIHPLSIDKCAPHSGQEAGIQSPRMARVEQSIR
ncbi:MAG: hypothetical protein ACFCVA_18885, partial [Gammaproteobacteria bacterium]